MYFRRQVTPILTKNTKTSTGRHIMLSIRRLGERKKAHRKSRKWESGNVSRDKQFLCARIEFPGKVRSHHAEWNEVHETKKK